MTLRSITLMLPSELINQLQQLVTDSPDALHQFVIQAIERELQRRQRVSQPQAFWAKVESIHGTYIGHYEKSFLCAFFHIRLR